MVWTSVRWIVRHLWLNQTRAETQRCWNSQRFGSARDVRFSVVEFKNVLQAGAKDVPERCPKASAFGQGAMATPGLNLSSETELEPRENCVQAEYLMLECYKI